MSTIQERNYVEKDENRKFQPTEIGVLVNDILVEHFPKIVDVGFTAKMEEGLDEISQGKEKWVPMIKEFYGPFIENLKLKEKEVLKKKLTEETKEACPECRAPLVIRISRYGKFYACSKFPKCRYKKNIPESLGINCPKCKKGEIILKKTRTGKIFYGCSNWPKCDFALWDRPLTKIVKGRPAPEICPKCGSLIVKTKWGKIKCSNPECLE